ncbi:MAG: type II toxin-antitoxin system RelE/ParE family toxin [Alphaproteobacteria bacterium]|nr:type II toxin-antitoxin system RelE/ParE family toxin [Alphaproteobacteria bacterium]
MELLEYVTADGKVPFRDWFDRLNAPAAARVTVALLRLGQGNTSSIKAVGAGVFECRIDFGPGYRVYLGRSGERLVILLAGGTKQRQQRDIRLAQGLWAEFRQRKGQETRPWH